MREPESLMQIVEDYANNASKAIFDAIADEEKSQLKNLFTSTCAFSGIEGQHELPSSHDQQF